MTTQAVSACLSLLEINVPTEEALAEQVACLSSAELPHSPLKSRI